MFMVAAFVFVRDRNRLDALFCGTVAAAVCLTVDAPGPARKLRFADADEDVDAEPPAKVRRRDS